MSELFRIRPRTGSWDHERTFAPYVIERLVEKRGWFGSEYLVWEFAAGLDEPENFGRVVARLQEEDAAAEAHRAFPVRYQLVTKG